MAKVLVFRHLFWLVLSVVFITGATRISIFGFGYLLACFFFLLFGTKLLVKTSRTRLTLWDCLIIYNVGVIISKNMLSVSMWTLASPFMLQIVEMKNAVIIVVKVYNAKCVLCFCCRSWRVCLCLRCRRISAG